MEEPDDLLSFKNNQDLPLPLQLMEALDRKELDIASVRMKLMESENFRTSKYLAFSFYKSISRML